jgi:glycosyltransferase involved in cell wall biosynthesis
MRVLMLNHNVAGRGTYFRCMAYARHLVRKGHRVDVMTISPDRRRGFRTTEAEGVTVIHSPDLMWGLGRTGWDPWDALQRCRRLSGEKYDIVHGFDGRPVVRYPARYLQRRGVPYVSDWADWWGRGGVIAERKSALLRRYFAPIETYYEESCRPLADHVTAISSALVERALGLGVEATRVSRLPGGAEPDRVRPMDPGPGRARLGLGEDVPLVAYAGFVQYDIEYILQAFTLVHERIPSSRLLLVGPRIDAQLGLLNAETRAAVIQAGILAQADTLVHLAAADVLLLPFLPKQANLGRWPNKAGEYMCLGKAIVTNAVGDVREVVDAGAAVGTEPTPEAFAAAAVALLEDGDARTRQGQEARRAAQETFDYATRVGDLEALYTRLLLPSSTH